MNNKKSVIALLLVAIIGIVGLTFAYFSNSTDVENTFTTKEYGTEYIEEFVLPDNWSPGDTTNKTVVATNTGEVDQAVRIHVTETWTTHNDGTLNGWIHSDGTKSNHTTSEELANDERVAVLNLANASDWTKVGDYYYYNYKLAPGESTTSFLESVTFNPKTKLDDTCTESESNGVKTVTCSSSGDDYDNATYTLTLGIETVQYNQYNSAWNLNNTVTIVNTSKPVTLLNHIMSKRNGTSITNYTDGNKGEMYTFNHEATVRTDALIDYRYIGNDPYNYVYFNCDSDGTNCEIWRILGVFNVDDGKQNYEQKVKIVRGSLFPTGMEFDSNLRNDWANESLKVFLNGDYYNRTGAAETYGLKESARSMIDDSKFYLGLVSSIDPENSGYGNTEKIYGDERGTLINSRTTDWTGKVALMYPSDVYMVYANGVDNNCYNDPYHCKSGVPSTGWVYNSNILQGGSEIYNTWLLSPGYCTNACMESYIFGNLSDYGTTYDVSGSFGNSNDVDEKLGVRPVVYLSSSVKIIDGDGSSGNPYVLEEM